MIASSMIMGWVGISIFVLIASTFRKLIKDNEYAFLHVLMTFMYVMWLPLPLTFYRLLNTDLLLVGTIFGLIYLVMIVIAMALQAGHISYIVKHNDHQISEMHGDYMMAVISNPMEGLANIFKCIWAWFLGVSFWKNDEMMMAAIMFLFSLFFFYYLLIVLEQSVVKQMKGITNVKPNQTFVNLETFVFFLALVGYITIKP